MGDNVDVKETTIFCRNCQRTHSSIRTLDVDGLCTWLECRWPEEYAGAPIPLKQICRIWWHRTLIWVAGLGTVAYFVADRVAHMFGFCIGF